MLHLYASIQAIGYDSARLERAIIMPVRALRFLPMALLIAGCSKGNFNERKASGDPVLTYPIESKVTTLDPGKVQDVDMADVLRNVFEGLVDYNEKNVLSPRLAEKWEFTNGGRTIVFHLRAAKFQNGRAVTADDFRWTWERNLGKALGSPIAADYLGAIEGVPAFIDGKAKSISGLKVIDERTLSVTLDKPRPYFLGNLTYACANVICKDVVGAQEMRSAAQVIGTGPFRLTRIAQDAQIDLEAFADYWGGKPKLSKIVRPVVTDPATRLSGYKNGNYDILVVPRADLANVQNDPKLKSQLRLENRPAVNYFSVNRKAYAPFRDERVRRAFAMALDRDHIVNDLLTGQVVAKGLVPPGVPGYDKNLEGIPHDPKAARALLAEAGFPDGKGLPPLELAFRSGQPDSRLACEAAATTWRRELNAPVSPKALEWGALLSRRNEGLLQMCMMSWYADYLDPQNFLSLLMISTSKMNNDGYSNAEFDRLCREADIDGDPARRLKLYQQAEGIAVQSVARIPLYFVRQPLLVSPRLKNLKTNLFGLMQHSTLEVGG